jgi:hypothetical protein
MPSRSYRNNNPGNLRYGKFAAIRGAVDDGDGYAKWTVAIRGTVAMMELLALPTYRDLSLADAIARYAPSGDNNKPREYAAYVAHRAGVPLEMKLAEMDPFQVLRVVEAMVRFEGWSK